MAVGGEQSQCLTRRWSVSPCDKTACVHAIKSSNSPGKLVLLYMVITGKLSRWYIEIRRLFRGFGSAFNYSLGPVVLGGTTITVRAARPSHIVQVAGCSGTPRENEKGKGGNDPEACDRLCKGKAASYSHFRVAFLITSGRRPCISLLPDPILHRRLWDRLPESLAYMNTSPSTAT